MVRRATLEDSLAATRARLLEEAPRLDFPVSVVGYFRGELGRPPNGFPEDLREAVLKGLPRIEGRPSDAMAPLDLEALGVELGQKHGRRLERHEVMSAALYPRVMDGYLTDRARFEDVSLLDTPAYFYGMEVGQEIWVDIEPGKTLVVVLAAVGEPDEDGMRTVYFELNGHSRQVSVRDRSRAAKQESRRQAEKGNPGHVGASMPGSVVSVHVKAGQRVEAGAPLLTLEAMKMETVVRAPRAGVVQEVLPALKGSVQGGELLVVLR
jgi:pyruvate carboxylase